MPDKIRRAARETAAMAAKQYVAANRTAMEAILRPFSLGNTQWWVLTHVASEGAVRQRDIAAALHVERATASEIVVALVRKGLVEQYSDPADQRQKLLRLTGAGRKLLAGMPDPLETLYEIAFRGVASDELAAVARVLGDATQRLLTTRSGEGATS